MMKRVTYHHDGTVTIWDQEWVWTDRPSAAALACLSARTRARVIRHVQESRP